MPQRTGQRVVKTGFAHLDTTLLAKMAAVTGKTADATKYADLASRIAAGFTKRYFAVDTGVYANRTQLAYALPP
ncbi:alpha-L-rhamnosidase-related protein [Amycolatopsis sp. H20-H5]|uniref:alpha-L-rhamnosidase-related protein n=1 Tax=Amycolatopsis sp. H20-H5 TaxID=3046309 RepID=UPI002DBA9C86|nr:hypothetical protein [Amycolatopsis sp. H20-H5]MEC3977512.1 hypothetical protein [Amycolatopsis sp. H20-H5]